MQSQTINSAQMAMIVPHNLVLLQVPAFHGFILSARKQIGMSIRYSYSTHCVDMASQGDFELPIGEIPKLNGSIIRACSKEFIHRIHSDAPDPAGVTADDSLELPRSMPLDLNLFFMPQSYLILILIYGRH